jgi:hypothetical protein
MKNASFARLWVAVLSLAVAMPVYAQRQPHMFLKNNIKLTDAEIQKIGQGQVVTKVLESADKNGMLVFGAVYVNGSIQKFAEVYRDVQKLQGEKVYLAVQEFSKSGTPVKLSDFDRLELDKADIDALQHCKPGDCDLQIFSQIEETQKLVDWKSPDKYTKVNQVVRRRFFDEMSRYQKGGLKEFGSYRDRGTPFSLYQSMKDMVDHAYYLPKDKALDIYGHVVEYPQAKMKGAEDIFYWEKIDFGQGPVIRVNHVSLFPAGFGAAKLIGANKQLFASKYMRAALQMYYCVPDTQAPNKPGFYLITMSDSRLPDFGGLKLSIVRKIATSSAVAGARDTLQIYQRRTTGK